MPRHPPPDFLDLSTFRAYLVTRRHYSAEAIALRLMLRSAPADATSEPELLAWMTTSGQPPELVAHVSRARTLYVHALRAARARTARAG